MWSELEGTSYEHLGWAPDSRHITTQIPVVSVPSRYRHKPDGSPPTGALALSHVQRKDRSQTLAHAIVSTGSTARGCAVGSGEINHIEALLCRTRDNILAGSPGDPDVVLPEVHVQSQTHTITQHLGDMADTSGVTSVRSRCARGGHDGNLGQRCRRSRRHHHDLPGPSLRQA